MSPDISVRIRRSIIQIPIERTNFRRVIPFTAEFRYTSTRIPLSVILFSIFSYLVAESLISDTCYPYFYSLFFSLSSFVFILITIFDSGYTRVQSLFRVISSSLLSVSIFISIFVIISHLYYKM